MSPERQRSIIAEACGWTYQDEWLGWTSPEGECGIFNPPDYLNDLNAMHEAEKAIAARWQEERKGSWFWYQYLDVELPKVCERNRESNECASASSRCEAMVKVLGKWEDEA